MTKSALVEALEKKDFAKAKELLDNGENIPGDISEFTLRQLYENIIKGKGFAILDALVEKGNINTDIYEYDSFRYSIYELLVKHLPVDEASLHYLRNFVERSANNNDEVEGYTLLSYAIEVWAEPVILQTLIDAGQRTDFRNNAEDNLINQVVRINMMPKEKQLAYLHLLLKAGVDVNEPNIEKQNSVHIAVERDKKDLLDILLANGGRPNEQDWKGNTAFYYALAHKLDGEVYDKLTTQEKPDFSLQNREGQTILSEYLRMMYGDDKGIALLERLIDDGADLEQTAPYYNEPKSGWDWIAEKDAELLKRILIKTGRNINKQDDNGNTLLHKICAINCNFSQEGAKSIYKKVKLLLESGADTEITNAKEETALKLALNDNLKAKTVDLLLKAKNNQEK